MDRIVVTGAGHPLAWRLGAYLLDRGYAVTAVADSQDLELPALPWKLARLAEGETVSPSLFDGARGVVHFARSEAPNAPARVAEVVAAVDRSRGRPLVFVGVSSLEALSGTTGLPVDETAGLPAAPDGQSIAQIERTVRSLSHGRGRSIVARLAAQKSWIGGVVGASWIHEEDAVALLAHCLFTPALEGTVHVVAPEHRDAEGVRAVPTRALATGFRFRYPTIEHAMTAASDARIDWADLDVVKRAYWVAESPDRLRFFPGSTGRYRLSLKGLPVAWETRRERLGETIDAEDLVRGAFQTFQRRQRITRLGEGALVEDAVAFRVRGGALIGRWVHQAVREKLFAALDSAESLGDPGSFESQLASELEVPLNQ